MPYDINQFSPGYGGTINSSGNVVNIADTLDEATGQFKPPAMKQFTFQSGATAIGNGTAADVSGYATLIIQVTISAVATVAFEASLDGTNYFSISTNSPNATGASQNTTNAAGTTSWRFNVAGFKFFRARISSFGSGTVDVIGYASTAPFSPQYLTTQAGSSDTNSATNILQAVGAYNLLYDGTNWVRQRTGVTGDGTNNNTVSANGLFGYNGTTWDRVRVGKVYRHIEYLTLPDATGTTIWTPASGKKFRLMGISVSCGSAGRLAIRDGNSGTDFIARFLYAGADTKTFDFGNGYLSLQADRVLELRNNSGATVNAWVTAWGTEE